MEDGERRIMLRLLAEGSDALRSAVDGIDGPEAARKPADFSWSVLDCLEHVAVTESALFAGIRNATPAGAPQHNPEREAKISNRALDRGRFIAAPEIVVPAGRFATAAEALAAFQSARAETVRWVETFQDDPRKWLTTHPMVRTPVNCWEMLLMIALHPTRHALQIATTRAAIAAQ
jgi:uncharacterized damage-inducible protein DinB